MLTKLPKKHLRIGAAFLFGFGLFQSVMIYLGAEFVNRPYVDKPYALAEFSDWLVSLLGRLGAAIAFLLVFSAGAVVLLRMARNARD